MQKVILASVTCALLALAMMFACGGSSGGDDDAGSGDDDAGATCNIPGTGLVEVPGGLKNSGCESLGLSITVDKVLANDSLTIYEVQGQYSINNNNKYYLRGKGLDEQEVCYEKIEKSGTYSVLRDFLECTTSFSIDVVTSLSPDAMPFCTFNAYTTLNCTDDDTSDDDLTDDDSGTDHTTDCANIVGSLYESCGYAFGQMTEQEASDSCVQGWDDFWSCALDCLNSSQYCEDYASCLESC